MSGQPRPKGRRLHIMHHRVRHASINKSAKLFSKKKIRGGECKGGIYRLLWGVSPDRPRGYEDTSWTKALEAWQTTVRGWTWPQPTSCIDAKILPRPSLMVRQTRQEEHPYLFMREGQEHSRTASLHELYLASVCDFYETLGRIQSYWQDSILENENYSHTHHEGTVARNRYEGRRIIPRGNANNPPF